VGPDLDLAATSRRASRWREQGVAILWLVQWPPDEVAERVLETPPSDPVLFVPPPQDRVGPRAEAPLTVSASAASAAFVPSTSAAFGKIVAHSRAVKALKRDIRLVALTRTTVLLSGESGTGKELVARAIHQLGHIASAPFVTLDCSAVPSTLFEGELFGHERGAFTGAVSRRVGRFEQAHGGTLFLDDVSEMSLAVQAVFLRVLEDKRVRRIGGDEEREVDVRVIAATNRDLVERCRGGLFREDLYYRLSVIELPIPPLRERKEDILFLAQGFLAEFAGQYGMPSKRLTPRAEQALEAYTWPGNVRELKNVLERAFVTSRGPRIGAAAVSGQLRGVSARPEAPSLRLGPGMTLDRIEREAILHALEACGGNRRRAAAMLGISVRTLHYRLRRWRDEGQRAFQFETKGAKIA
jgi:DNA-binding NtrC family response regulator